MSKLKERNILYPRNLRNGGKGYSRERAEEVQLKLLDDASHRSTCIIPRFKIENLGGGLWGVRDTSVELTDVGWKTNW